MRIQIIDPGTLMPVVLDREITEVEAAAVLDVLSACAADGNHHAITINATHDATCSKCGERLLLPGTAGGPQ